MVELELHKALRLQYPVSLVTVLVESPTAEVMQTVEAIRELLRSSDVVGLTPGLFMLHLLLPDTLLPEAERVIERIRASALLSSVKLKFGAACFPTTAQTAHELREKADRDAIQPEPGS
jgi:hypothetical protein